MGIKYNSDYRNPKMRSKSKLVSVIIVNWNGEKHLSYCLPSLEKIDYSSFEIIVVDNGSTDDSVKYVETHFPKIKIIQNKKNLGFAKANNIGLKKAKGECILFLNSDTKVTPNFLTRLIKVMEKDKKIGVVQPKIVFMDSGKLQAGGAFLTNTGFLYHFGYGRNPDEKKYNQQTEILSANGSCMLAKREAIEKVGLFDPDFFCYFEETDFCWRAWLAGYKIVYVPDSVICHKGAQTAKRLKSNFINYHSFKNRIASLIKNLGSVELFKTMPTHLLFCQLAFFAFLVMGRFSNAWAVQKAIGWNFLHLGKTLEKRRKVQDRIRKISDRELMSKIKRPVRPLYYYHLLSGLKEYED